MFTLSHFIWLFCSAAVITELLIFAKKTDMQPRTASFIMAGIAFVSEFVKMMSSMEPVAGDDGMVLDPGALPFHLCSLMVFVVLYIAFSGNEKVKAALIRFLVPVGIAGAAAAMLIPTSGVDFADIDAWQCFVYHAGLIWYALYFVVTRRVDLGLRTYLRNVATLAALALIMIYVNGALSVYNTNFMYVVRPPMSGLPILNLDHGWYAYFAGLSALGLVLMTVVHLPGMIAEAIRKKAGKSNG